MPLNVTVVGAGIAGLCAAVALHQAGHNVIVFEKSKFAAEIGAALVLSPNGSRVLRHLGFSFERARGCRITAWDTLDGATLTKLKNLDLAEAEEEFGAPLVTVHRVDLHKELLRLASEPTCGSKRRVDLRLNSRVVHADAGNGAVELADGSVHTADLVVAADGLHSVVKEAVLGSQIPTPRDSGCSAFRFLIPTEQLMHDPEIAMTMRDKCRGPTILADLTEGVVDRHIVWYDCQGGEIQNFVGILPNHPEAEHEDSKVLMLREFGHFHPLVGRIIRKTTDVIRWPLFVHEPIPKWSRGKIILIGDASHPMLPYGGQGSNQAIEDAGALGYLFDKIHDPGEIPSLFNIFEAVRVKRASRSQVLGSVRVGREAHVKEALLLHADPPGSAVPESHAERSVHDYGFDVYQECARAVESQRQG